MARGIKLLINLSFPLLSPPKKERKDKYIKVVLKNPFVPWEIKLQIYSLFFYFFFLPGAVGSKKKRYSNADLMKKKTY